MEDRRAKILQRIQEFRLLDDDFMTKCFEDNIEATELVLNIIMDKKLKVQSVHTQHNIKSLQGRSVRLDIFASDENGKLYDIEIQRADKGAGAKRARYNSSLMDANVLDAGDEFEKLKDTYVIFITENDVIGADRPIYHIDRYIRETGKEFNDGTHIIYVNASYKDDTPLGKLMNDFCCANPNDMNYKLLADRARYFKEDEKGVATMCKMMEDMLVEDRKETLKQAMIEMAVKMLKKNTLSVEEIAEFCDLTEEEVKELAENVNACMA